MDILGGHHIALYTANFDQMRAFYSQTLGLPEIGAFPGRNIVFFGLGSTAIELVEKEGQGPNAHGWQHLAFEVQDVDGACQHLRELGITFSVMPKDFPADAPQARIAFFADPDGNELELFQPLGQRYPAAG